MGGTDSPESLASLMLFAVATLPESTGLVAGSSLAGTVLDKLVMACTGGIRMFGYC